KVTVELRDQVPRSGRDKVDVKVVAIEPAPVAPPDGEGVVRWRVELAPGATRTVRLRYQITRPKGWQLYQQCARAVRVHRARSRSPRPSGPRRARPRPRPTPRSTPSSCSRTARA